MKTIKAIVKRVMIIYIYIYIFFFFPWPNTIKKKTKQTKIQKKKKKETRGFMSLMRITISERKTKYKSIHFDR
jgi:hypothetical protein